MITLSKFVRLVLLLFLCALAISPVVIAPGIAESYGYDRSTGSSVGALIGMAAFALMGWVSIKIIRKQARREVGQEVNRLLYPYRDEEDKGKP